MTAASVAVAVVSWNNRELLASCLRSLEPDVRSGRAEVWVVDNASTDGSPAMVRDDFPWAQLVASPENLGYGRAINVVAAGTQAPWVVAANDDVEVTPGALERLVAAGEASPAVGAVAPRLVLPDGSIQHAAYPFPTVRLAALFNLGVLQRSPALADRCCLEGHWDGERARTVPWAIAAFLLVRRSAFAGIGGFAEDQFMFAEDLDLGWRLQRAGWRTWYEPGAVVRHAGSVATTAAYGEARTARWLTATYGWMLRRRGTAPTAGYAAANLAGAAARAALFGAGARRDPARWQPLARANAGWMRLHAGSARAALAERRAQEASRGRR